jgi:hypothetical protein
MAQERSRDKRRVAKPVPPKRCPWCQGHLELKPSFPIRAMIPGAVSTRGEEHIPEVFRTMRAWVCATPHCRYRETA